MVPVGFAGVGILVTPARPRVLREEKQTLRIQLREGWRVRKRKRSRVTYTAYGIRVVHGVKGLIVLPETTKTQYYQKIPVTFYSPCSFPVVSLLKHFIPLIWTQVSTTSSGLLLRDVSRPVQAPNLNLSQPVTELQLQLKLKCRSEATVGQEMSSRHLHQSICVLHHLRRGNRR